MARVGNITFVPSSSGGATGLIPLDQIPEEIKLEVEEVYEVLKGNDGRMRVAFETEAEVKQFIAQVNSYCEQRPVGTLVYGEGENQKVIESQGPIRYRKSPTHGLPKTALDFRITDRKDESETPEKSEGASAKTPAKSTRQTKKAA